MTKDQVEKLVSNCMEKMQKQRKKELEQKVEDNNDRIHRLTNDLEESKKGVQEWKQEKRKDILKSTGLIALACATIGFVPAAVTMTVLSTKDRDNVVEAYRASEEFGEIKQEALDQLDAVYANKAITYDDYKEKKDYTNSRKFAVEMIADSTYSVQYENAYSKSFGWILGTVIGGAICAIGGVISSLGASEAVSYVSHDSGRIEDYSRDVEYYEKRIADLKLQNSVYNNELSQMSR